MPWTFAHPAALIPLFKQKRLSLSALIVGSISPDLPYYIARFDWAYLAHTPRGIVLVCLPLALIVLILLHVLRMPLLNILPLERLRYALLQTSQKNLSFDVHGMVWLLLAIGIGAATHVAWDGFTHKTGYFVQMWPALQQSVLLAGKAFPIYNLLQHASTLFGVAFLAWAYQRYLPPVPVDVDKAPNQRRWIRLISIGIMAMLLGLLLTLVLRAPETAGGWPLPALGVNWILNSSSAFFGLMMVTALFSKRRSA